MHTVISFLFHTEGDWINAKSGLLPEYGRVCAAIYKYSIGIIQFRKPDGIYSKEPYFLSLTDMWQQMEYDDPDLYYPTFASMEILSYWMPLELPEEIKKRIDNQIRQTYMYDEDDE